MAFVCFILPLLGFILAIVPMSSTDAEIRAAGKRYLEWALVGLFVGVAAYHRARSQRHMRQSLP